MVRLRRAVFSPTPPADTTSGVPLAAPSVDSGAVSTGRARLCGDRAILRACFGPLALGYLVAIICGAALAWDSGGIFFQMLDMQAPVTPNQRWLNAIVQAPALLASNFSDNLGLLGFVFGVTWALLPLGALAASWLIVRCRAPELFLWPVLTIGLGLLPGIFYLGTEANIALMLAWPIFLATLLGVSRSSLVAVAVCALLLAISHPYAIGLFALLTALALLIWQREGQQRRELTGWAFAFGILTFLTALRFLLFHTSYESAQLSLGALGWNFLVAVRGYPAAALGCAAIVGVLFLLLPYVGAGATRTIRVVQLAALLLLAVLMVLWARDPHLWSQANKYSYPALPVTLAFMALTLVDRVRSRPVRPTPRRVWLPRLQTIRLVALIFALVMSVQGASWFGLTQQLRRTIATSPASCISMAPLGWLRQTPLDQFATPAYALLLQGRTPERLVLSGNGCGEEQFSAGVNLNQYYLRGWQGGWFNLEPLRTALFDQQQNTGVCSVLLTTGWNDTETSDPYWWRWSSGQDSRIRILAAADGQFILNGQIESYRSPNRVTIIVNDVPQQTVDITQGGQNMFSPLTFSLKQGVNEVRLVSRNPAQLVGERALSFDVANLTLTRGDSGQLCRFQP